jgi:hypothetical protein
MWYEEGQQQRVLNDLYGDRAFSPSYGLAPTPTRPTSPSPGSKLDWRHTGRLGKRDNLQTEEGVEPNHATARKPERCGHERI